LLLENKEKFISKLKIRMNKEFFMKYKLMGF